MAGATASGMRAQTLMRKVPSMAEIQVEAITLFLKSSWQAWKPGSKKRQPAPAAA